MKATAQLFVHGDRHLDAIRQTGRFHALRQVDGLSPQVIREFLAPDHSGHNRPGVQADAQAQAKVAFLVDFTDHVQHLQGHLCRRFGMVRSWLWHTTDDHITVPDGFDFFQIVGIGELVESGEEVVQQVDQGFGGHLVCQGGETDEVRKQDRDAGVALSNVAFTLFEPSGDGCRQDIQEEPLRLFLFDFEQLFFLLQLKEPESFEIAQALSLERCSHPRPEEDGVRWLG